MGSMSYCLFDNTLGDLQQCKERMLKKLSASEDAQRGELVELMAEILSELGVFIDPGELLSAHERLGEAQANGEDSEDA